LELIPGARPELGQVAEGGGGVVVSLATRPALAVRVAGLGRSDLLDDRVWSLLGDGVEEARPVEQAAAGDGAGQGVLSGGRIGAGDPEAVGMVAVAALLGDQLSEAAVMVGGPTGSPVSGPAGG
jgi:hypothetical protein